MKVRWKPVLAIVTITTLSALSMWDRVVQAKPQHLLAATSVVNHRSLPTTLPPPLPPPAFPPSAAPATSDEAQTYRVSPKVSADLFAAKSWYVAPPAPPPPKPVAPPFPYVLTGSLREGEELVLFLSLGERNFIVHKGEKLGTQYQVDDISDDQAMFTYLPLQQQQQLQIGISK